MAKMRIDGSGTGEPANKKKNISKRAVKGLLGVKLSKCPHCNHHKKFTGNLGGQGINKCTKCKRRY